MFKWTQRSLDRALNFRVAIGAFALGVATLGQPAYAAFDLQITEIWSGQDGSDLTEDWFEISNVGNTAFTFADVGTTTINDGFLFYDDVSADLSDAVQVEGFTSILPNESVVVVIGDGGDRDEWNDVWDDVVSLPAAGFTDGSGLGAGGDTVNLWIVDSFNGTNDGPADPTGTPDVSGSYPGGIPSGVSYDNSFGGNSFVGDSSGAVETTETAGNSGNEPAIGSPGSFTANATPSPALIWDDDDTSPGIQNGGTNDWTLDPADMNFQDDTNTNVAFTSGEDAQFGDGAGDAPDGNYTVSVDNSQGAVTAGQVTFAESDSTYTIDGDQLTVENGITADNNATIDADVSLTGSAPVLLANNGNTLSLNGTLSSANTVTLSGGGSEQGFHTLESGFSSAADFNLGGTVTVEVQNGASLTGTINAPNTGGERALTGDATIAADLNVGDEPDITIAGNLTFTGSASMDNGNLDPGAGQILTPNKLDTAGTLTFDTGLSLGTASGDAVDYSWSLFGNTTAGAGTNYDQVVLGDALTDSSGTSTIEVGLYFDQVGQTNTVDFDNSFWSTSQSWTIIDVEDTSGSAFDNVVLTPNAFNAEAIGNNRGVGIQDFSITTDVNGDIILNYDVPPAGTIGLVAVTEFLSNPVSAGQDFIELFNPTTTDFTLNGWSIVNDENNDVIEIPDGTVIGSGAFLVLVEDKAAFEADFFGGTPTAGVIETALAEALNLDGGEDQIVLLDGQGNEVWRLAYANDETEGISTYLSIDDFTQANFGDADNPGIVRVGDDLVALGTGLELGYEEDGGFAQAGGLISNGGDWGSPLAGSYTADLTFVIPEPASLMLLSVGGALMLGRSRRHG